MSHDIIGVVVGACITLVGVFITTIIESCKEKATIKKKQYYLTIRVICTLEKFINHCARVVTDGAMEDNYNNQIYNIPDPETLNFPRDLDWKVLDDKLVYKILSIENEIININHIISFAFECHSTDIDRQDRDIAKNMYSKLGINAYGIIQEIKKKYKIKLIRDSVNIQSSSIYILRNYNKEIKVCKS